MKIEVKIKHILIAILALAGLIYGLSLFYKAKYQPEIDRLNTGLLDAHRTINEYRITVDSITNYVFETNLISVSKDKYIRELEDEKERLEETNIKRVDVIGKLRIQVRALRDSLKSVEPIVIINKEGEQEGQYAKLPLEYSWADQYARAWAKVNTEGLGEVGFAVDSLDLTLVLGKKKQGLFRSTPVSSVQTPNPYVNVNKNNVIVIDHSPSPWTYVGLGAGGGVALMIGLHLLLGR